MKPTGFSSLHVDLFRFTGISFCFSNVDRWRCTFPRTMSLYVYADDSKSLLLFGESVHGRGAPLTPPKGHDESVMCHSELKTARWEEHQEQAMRQQETFPGICEYYSNQKRWRKRSAVNNRPVFSLSSLWNQTEGNKKLGVLQQLWNI